MLAGSLVVTAGRWSSPPPGRRGLSGLSESAGLPGIVPAAGGASAGSLVVTAGLASSRPPGRRGLSGRSESAGFSGTVTVVAGGELAGSVAVTGGRELSPSPGRRGLSGLPESEGLVPGGTSPTAMPGRAGAAPRSSPSLREPLPGFFCQPPAGRSGRGVSTTSACCCTTAEVLSLAMVCRTSSTARAGTPWKPSTRCGRSMRSATTCGRTGREPGRKAGSSKMAGCLGPSSRRPGPEPKPGRPRSRFRSGGGMRSAVVVCTCT